MFYFSSMHQNIFATIHTCRGTQKTHNKTLYFNTSKDSSDTIKKKTAEKM